MNQPENQSNGKPENEQHRRRLLTPVAANSPNPSLLKPLRWSRQNYLRLPYNKEELREIVEQTLSYKLRYVDTPACFPHHEKIEFELPSDLTLMNGVLQYLLERVAKLGLMLPNDRIFFIALMKHS